MGLKRIIRCGRFEELESRRLLTNRYFDPAGNDVRIGRGIFADGRLG